MSTRVSLSTLNGTPPGDALVAALGQICIVGAFGLALYAIVQLARGRARPLA